MAAFVDGILASPITMLVVMVGGFLWLRTDVKRIEGKVDGLAKDHNALARELSEVKGYLRRELPGSPPARG